MVLILQSVVLLFEETKRGGESSECAYQESCKFLIIERHNALLDVRVGVKGIRGNYKPDDQFIMATDALAEWFLRTCEKGERPWSELDKIGTAEHFHEFIKSLRQAGGIKDDDVSIIRIDLKNVELMVV